MTKKSFQAQKKYIQIQKENIAKLKKIQEEELENKQILEENQLLKKYNLRPVIQPKKKLTEEEQLIEDRRIRQETIAILNKKLKILTIKITLGISAIILYYYLNSKSKSSPTINSSIINGEILELVRPFNPDWPTTFDNSNDGTRDDNLNQSLLEENQKLGEETNNDVFFWKAVAALGIAGTIALYIRQNLLNTTDPIISQNTSNTSSLQIENFNESEKVHNLDIHPSWATPIVEIEKSNQSHWLQYIKSSNTTPNLDVSQIHFS
jgi:hypothetical protein